MATFRKRGKRWQAIIRKSVQKPVVKIFPNKVQAETWARGVETDMDRQTWEGPTLLKEKTVNDVIAAMTARQGVNKAQKTVYNNPQGIWVWSPCRA